jgi:hypothetical protein
MAVQLIKKSGKRLELCPDALDHLRKIQDEFGTCVCVGPYRQGKSFLLNLLVNDKKAFQIGHSDQGCTKGVWMHKEPVKMLDSEEEEINVLFFDTEVNYNQSISYRIFWL